jgi:hypothetical protein
VAVNGAVSKRVRDIEVERRSSPELRPAGLKACLPHIAANFADSEDSDGEYYIAQHQKE